MIRDLNGTLFQDQRRAANGDNNEMAAYPPDAGDAAAVSTIFGECTARALDGRQKLPEQAPLIFVR